MSSSSSSSELEMQRSTSKKLFELVVVLFMHLKLLTYARRHGRRNGAKIKWRVKRGSRTIVLIFLWFHLASEKGGLLFGTKRRLNR